MSTDHGTVNDMADTTILNPQLPATLSPTRLGEYGNCPRKFWYHSVLRLPDPATEATVKGNVVHAALEHLFDHPRDERTPATARAELAKAFDEAWNDPANAHIAAAGDALRAKMYTDCETLVAGYFKLEDPKKFDPSEREFRITGVIGGVPVVGIIDRLDRIAAADGERIYVSDFKTGRPPKGQWEDKAFRQLRIYAALLEAATGERTHELRLVYLADRDGGVRRRKVTDADLAITKTEIMKVWSQIQTSAATGVWEPQVSALCDYCPFQQLCPARGGDDDGGRFTPLPIITP